MKTSKYGNINDAGIPRTFAKIYKVSDPEFWDSIEPGIKPLVKTIVDLGFETYTSCEGHYYGNDLSHSKDSNSLFNCDDANIRFVTNTEDFVYDKLNRIIDEYNMSHNAKIIIEPSKVIDGMKYTGESLLISFVEMELRPVTPEARIQINELIRNFAEYLYQEYIK